MLCGWIIWRCGLCICSNENIITSVVWTTFIFATFVCFLFTTDGSSVVERIEFWRVGLISQWKTGWKTVDHM